MKKKRLALCSTCSIFPPSANQDRQGCQDRVALPPLATHATASQQSPAMLPCTHHAHTCDSSPTQTCRIMLEPAATQTKALQQHTCTRKHTHTQEQTWVHTTHRRRMQQACSTHACDHAHACTGTRTNTDTQGPGKTMSPTSVHANFGKKNTMTHAEAHAPHEMLVHTHMGLAPLCLYGYMFLCMYVHGNVHIRSTPAASFSHVLSMYAMAITHAHGCTTTCTHTEPCAQRGTCMYTCENCLGTCVTLPVARSSRLLRDAGMQGICRI